LKPDKRDSRPRLTRLRFRTSNLSNLSKPDKLSEYTNNMPVQFTGFTDEAGFDLATQIKAIQSLGWSHLSLRSIEGTNAHDLPDEAFAKAADALDEAGIEVAEFGSLKKNRHRFSDYARRSRSLYQAHAPHRH